jgi:hypothetical protein
MLEIKGKTRKPSVFAERRLSRAGDGARTHDSHVGNADVPGHNPCNGNTYGDAVGEVALRVAQLPTDPDLARVVEAWPHLPEAIRRAVLALVGSATS